MTENSIKAWSGRFSKALDKRVAKFNASLPFDYVLFEYDLDGSKAHAKMLAKQALITEQESALICSALEEIRQEFRDSTILLDDEFEDVHMLIEHILIKKIGDIGKKLHTGRSRNDQVALDLKLYTRHQSEKIETLLRTLISTLEHLYTRHKNDKMPGYTHLQQAQVISLGHYFGAYRDMFLRDLSRIEDWYKRMNFSPLGAGALAGSSLPIDRQMIATLLEFSGIVENTIDSVSDRDYVIELQSILSIIMMHLSRISEDLILWATQEFSFVFLDDAFATCILK